jgi:prepilin-type N-terminal cleavage/methylation domain-containing protein
MRLRASVNQGRQAGFSLVELLVVLAILTIVMAAVFQQVDIVQKRYRTEEMKTEMFQAARELLDTFVRDLHQAGYPSSKMFAKDVLKDPAENDSRLAAGLVSVDVDEIIFEADVDADGTVDSIRYRLVDVLADTNWSCPCIERSQVAKVDGAPTAQGTSYYVAVENVSGLTFAAFQRDGTEVALPATLAGGTADDIDTIQITIDVQAPYRDLQTNQRPTARLTASARISN